MAGSSGVARRSAASRRRVLVLCAVAMMMVAAAPTASSLGHGALDTVSPTLASWSCSGSRLDPRTQLPRWLRDCGRVDMSRGAEAAAHDVLDALAPALGLPVGGGGLRTVGVNRSQTGTQVRFQQFHHGIPVHLGQVLIHLEEDGTVRLVNSRAVPDLRMEVGDRIDRETAVARARERVPGRLRSSSAAELQVDASAGDEPRLVWHVTIPTADPFGDWHVLVPADGRPITDADVWNAVAHDNGAGQVHDPNPVQQTGNTALRDNDDATDVTLDSARVLTTLANLASDTTKLRGTAVDVTGPGVTGCGLPYSAGAADEPSRVYNYQRSDDRFEEVTVYAAIDGVQTWFQSLGMTNVHDDPIPVDVHCVSDDNSYFSSGDKALHFGDGGVDDAEDADIVVHEYGHAVHHDQVPGWGPGSNTEQRAIGEGWSDLLAGMYYAFNGDPTYLTTRRYCIGEWDATSYRPVNGSNPGSGCLRWIDGTNETSGADIGAYSGSPTQEHADGRYWSAAMTCVFEGMGADATARDDLVRMVLEHHFLLVPDSSNEAFEDSIAALLLVDENLNAGGHGKLITDCAVARNLIAEPPPPGDETPPVITVVLDPALPDGDNGWYRSDIDVDWTVADPESEIASSQGCDDTTVDADSAGLTLTCTATSEGGTSSRSVMLMRDATMPSLAPVVTPNPVQLGEPAEASAGATDATSGLDHAGCDPVDTTTVGSRTVSCTATDVAGNVGTGTATYQVIYPFDGFYAPVASLPEVNHANAGRSVPVSFSLAGNRGMAILPPGTPVSQPVACHGAAPQGPATSTDGNLHYDADRDAYQYVWKTNKSWSLDSDCRMLVLRLDDGSEHRALFRFGPR